MNFIFPKYPVWIYAYLTQDTIVFHYSKTSIDRAWRMDPCIRWRLSLMPPSQPICWETLEWQPNIGATPQLLDHEGNPCNLHVEVEATQDRPICCPFPTQKEFLHCDVLFTENSQYAPSNPSGIPGFLSSRTYLIQYWQTIGNINIISKDVWTIHDRSYYGKVNLYDNSLYFSFDLKETS